MGTKVICEYACDCCGCKVIADIKPDGWVTIDVEPLPIKAYCKSCVKAIKAANTSAGYK